MKVCFWKILFGMVPSWGLLMFGGGAIVADFQGQPFWGLTPWLGAAMILAGLAYGGLIVFISKEHAVKEPLKGET